VGNNKKYSMKLSETCGAVMATMGMAEGANRVKVYKVDNGTWKKELLLNGHATKDDVRNYITATHPAYAAFCGDDQDAYDACCIALYGVTVLERAQHLSL
jgi:Holliday junction resolvasome RuvABC endonuclease subunit